MSETKLRIEKELDEVEKVTVGDWIEINIKGNTKQNQVTFTSEIMRIKTEAIVYNSHDKMFLPIGDKNDVWEVGTKYYKSSGMEYTILKHFKEATIRVK